MRHSLALGRLARLPGGKRALGAASGERGLGRTSGERGLGRAGGERGLRHDDNLSGEENEGGEAENSLENPSKEK